MRCAFKSSCEARGGWQKHQMPVKSTSFLGLASWNRSKFQRPWKDLKSRKQERLHHSVSCKWEDSSLWLCKDEATRPESFSRRGFLVWLRCSTDRYPGDSSQLWCRFGCNSVIQYEEIMFLCGTLFILLILKSKNCNYDPPQRNLLHMLPT